MRVLSTIANWFRVESDDAVQTELRALQTRLAADNGGIIGVDALPELSAALREHFSRSGATVKFVETLRDGFEAIYDAPRYHEIIDPQQLTRAAVAQLKVEFGSADPYGIVEKCLLPLRQKFHAYHQPKNGVPVQINSNDIDEAVAGFDAIENNFRIEGDLQSPEDFDVLRMAFYRALLLGPVDLGGFRAPRHVTAKWQEAFSEEALSTIHALISSEPNRHIKTAPMWFPEEGLVKYAPEW